MGLNLPLGRREPDLLPRREGGSWIRHQGGGWCQIHSREEDRAGSDAEKEEEGAGSTVRDKKGPNPPPGRWRALDPLPERNGLIRHQGRGGIRARSAAVEEEEAGSAAGVEEEAGSATGEEDGSRSTVREEDQVGYPTGEEKRPRFAVAAKEDEDRGGADEGRGVTAKSRPWPPCAPPREGVGERLSMWEWERKGVAIGEGEEGHG